MSERDSAQTSYASVVAERDRIFAVEQQQQQKQQQEMQQWRNTVPQALTDMRTQAATSDAQLRSEFSSAQPALQRARTGAATFPVAGRHDDTAEVD